MSIYEFEGLPNFDTVGVCSFPNALDLREIMNEDLRRTSLTTTGRRLAWSPAERKKEKVSGSSHTDAGWGARIIRPSVHRPASPCGLDGDDPIESRRARRSVRSGFGLSIWTEGPPAWAAPRTAIPAFDRFGSVRAEEAQEL